MQPENKLFNVPQFEAAIKHQDQRERVNRSAETVIDACKKGTVTQSVTSEAYRMPLAKSSYGREADHIPYEVRQPLTYPDGRAVFRFAEAHDRFTWQDMVEGESYFAVLEVKDVHGQPKDVPYDILRLVNVPAGAPTTADERGLYIARPRDDGGETVMFKIVDNPNYQQQVTQGASMVDDNNRALARQVITDERRFIPQPLTPEEAIAAADELELAARVYSQG